MIVRLSGLQPLPIPGMGTVRPHTPTTMRVSTLLPAALPALALGAVMSMTAPTVSVGDPLPAPELEAMKQTGAKSFDDFVGRAVLIEFFEYW